MDFKGSAAEPEASRQATGREWRISIAGMYWHNRSGEKHDDANLHQNGAAAMAAGYVERN
jgi:hypothetical protein